MRIGRCNKTDKMKLEEELEILREVKSGLYEQIRKLNSITFMKFLDFHANTKINEAIMYVDREIRLTEDYIPNMKQPKGNRILAYETQQKTT